MGIKYLEESFYEALRELQARGVGLIPEGVNVGENMTLRRALWRGSSPEVFMSILETAVIEAKNRWIKREIWVGGGKRLNIIATYTQVVNTFGISIRYLQTL